MKTGFIALHRKLLDSPIWQVTTIEQKVILITLLLMANHSEKKWYWQGEEFICQPGQFITSLPNIAKTAGKNLTVQNVRTALKKFENLNFLTDKSTKTGRLITIVNWQVYQGKRGDDSRQPNSQLTDGQQTPNSQPNSQLTSNNNDNNITMINNDNNKYKQTQNGLEVNGKNAYQIWESNIGLLTPMLAERIDDLVNEVGLPIFTQAVIKSLERGKRTFAYVQSVARGIANGSDSDGKPKSNNKPDNAATQYNTGNTELLGTVL